MKLPKIFAVFGLFFCWSQISPTVIIGAELSCDGSQSKLGTRVGLALADGGFAAWSSAFLNSDGSARAYNPLNQAAGALIHLCNAGDVYLPDGSHYVGSESNATCVGKFMQDYARIGSAGWHDGSVGAINWYGVLGKGSATVAGKKINNVEPVLQPDGSGFYVSPTKLEDTKYKIDDQRRYIEPLTVPAAVIPSSNSLNRLGVVQGSFGVAIRRDKSIAVPFIVGDQGPQIGEVTPALGRQLAGLAIDPQLPVSERYKSSLDDDRVLYVFFGKTIAKPPFDASSIASSAKKAFKQWGGEQRLSKCLVSGAVPKN